MSRQKKHRQPVQKSLTLLLSTVALGGYFSIISPSRALAKTFAPQSLNKQAQTLTDEQSSQRRRTLRELYETIIERPSAPPAAEPATGATEPSETTTDPTASETEEEAVSLLLRLNERRVYVYRGDAVEVSYPVAVGRTGWETPTGEFEVFHQLEDPGWTNPLTGAAMPPGPDNPLGDRWIAFWTDGNNMIGFHGTPNRESVGQAASHGCIRMYNEDVRALYDIVSVGTPVMVVQ